MIARELTLAMLLGLLPVLDAKHREEIIRSHGDLERWAVDRCTQPGVAWGLFDGHEIVLAGGVIGNGAKGTLWLAGREGWQRAVLHPVRVFRELLAASAYQELDCTCYEDNAPAQRFAEYLGMERERVENGLVHYRRAA